MAVSCPKCQSDNPGTSRFCATCGTQLPSVAGAEALVSETLQTPAPAGEKK